jgi:hypothetical protein
MHDLINKLAFSLFKKNGIEECTIEEIESLAKKFPYFSSAQLLLAAKEKQIGHNEFEKQLAVTSLHVSNTLWLDHLLNADPSKTKIIVESTLAATEINNEPNNDELVIERKKHEFVAASNQQEEIILIEEEETITIPEPPPPTSEVAPEPELEPISAPSLVPEQAVTKDEKLVFEPYYTVDYFASQGIKNNIEKEPNDRFSKQLRSFTDWLKTIRQMPPQQVAALSDTNAEQKVVQLATHSIEDRNVETEAMAEVWTKQGHPEKAIDIYNKLSLLNPSKSSYFASLIESLKKI